MIALLLACAQAPQPPAAPESTATEQPEAPAQTAQPDTADTHVPPARDAYPDGEFGEAVRRGEAIFHNVQDNAPEYSGNSLTCANCHIDDGRRADAAPMWAAWVRYPAYRGKNKHVNDFDERLRGCFTYSMNGQASEHGSAPEPGSQVIVDLEAYAYWLATGAPTGEAHMKGQGFPKLDRPEEVSVAHGAEVYTARCATCHGADGQGKTGPDGEVILPPLWGPDSYNWGAGMHRVNTAAGFIWANMPLGQPKTLSEQEAWDVASYINAKPRPGDPRDAKGIQATDAEFHNHDCHYGESVDGQRLGAR
ncbi:MAG: c-type cytochrome [Myxococcota bacterium]|nr:c-type cytochrome [Myxococcota bacterium]